MNPQDDFAGAGAVVLAAGVTRHNTHRRGDEPA